MRYTKISMTDVIIAGAGAAGLMTAITAARRGLSVTVLEPNGKTGKKLRITGKGRCNVTNDSAPQEFLQKVCTNARFLKSSLYAFPPEAVKDFFAPKAAATQRRSAAVLSCWAGCTAEAR